jgi:hypothetical protein
MFQVIKRDCAGTLGFRFEFHSLVGSFSVGLGLSHYEGKKQF